MVAVAVAAVLIVDVCWAPLANVSLFCHVVRARRVFSSSSWIMFVKSGAQ